MKGALVKVGILNFFTRQDPFIHHAKFHLQLRPPSSFFEFFEIIDKFCLLKNFDLFYVQNLGHCRAKQTLFRSVGLKMDEKQAVTFALFFYISESPKGHLSL